VKPFMVFVFVEGKTSCPTAVTSNNFVFNRLRIRGTGPCSSLCFYGRSNVSDFVDLGIVSGFDSNRTISNTICRFEVTIAPHCVPLSVLGMSARVGQDSEPNVKSLFSNVWVITFLNTNNQVSHIEIPSKKVWFGFENVLCCKQRVHRSIESNDL